MIDILDYGIGNIGSIQNMIKFIGGNSRIISSPDQVLVSKKLILPGVGSYDAAISALKDNDLFDSLIYAGTENKTIILGICLGMQLLFDGSEEGKMPGLGLINGYVNKFKLNNAKVPHVGWNNIIIKNDSSLFLKSEAQQRFYFTHSYFVKCSNEKDIIAECNHEVNFTCAVENQNILGTQFHPEKSHKYGITLFSKFNSL